MANRQERREAAKANEVVAVLEGLAGVAIKGEIGQPTLAVEAAPPLTVNEAGDLLAIAQREIEALQQQRAEDRETILNLRKDVADLLGVADASPLLSRDVAYDELDLDPRDAEAHPGGAAYDAGLKAGMLRAALICETRWASDIGRHCAHSIREAEEKIA